MAQPGMKIVDARDKKTIERLLTPADASDPAFDRRVRRIIAQVRTGGDRALTAFAKRFDRLAGPLEVSAAEMRKGAARVETAVRRAIGQAAANIAAVASRQMQKHFDFEVSPGVVVKQRVEPLARVGCYVPGWRLPLPSSLLMTAVPARVA